MQLFYSEKPFSIYRDIGVVKVFYFFISVICVTVCYNFVNPMWLAVYFGIYLTVVQMAFLFLAVREKN